jgi:uncharacterized membrane protein YecN with MAPEG domain
MVAFLMHTWFVWWILAIVFILRWMHVMSVQQTVKELPCRTCPDSPWFGARAVRSTQ